MTAKEAYRIVTSRFSAVRVAKCYEYDSVFVFQFNPWMLQVSKNPMLDGLLCVNKTTGEIRDFKPFRIPIDEYKRGKEISESMYKG